MASKPTSSMKTSLMMLKCCNRRKAFSVICILAMLIWYKGYSAFIATSQHSILSMHIERRNELTSANYAGLKSGDTCICGQEVTQFAQLQYTNCQTPCSGGTGTCDDGHSIPKTVETPRWLGCFSPILNFAAENNIHRKNLTASDCILFCNIQELPLATLDDRNSCMCGRFNERFNLTNKINCTQPHWKVYRTFSEDARCDNIRFLPPANYSQTILATFPGSGNTWTRHLLERATGIYTGSVYGDKLLYKSGFLAELPEISKVRSVVVKDHMLDKNTMTSYQSAIVIIRNPYDAMIADFNRFASDGHHTAVVSEKRLQSKGKYVESVRTPLRHKKLIKVLCYVICRDLL
ncbi:unnamed protein product [Clavelina lepadiformis]|uniref:WSC domain-containing protein n=1 Tax=Clavelina lepadiformis TaxID=159417 RepID=A0ABP0FSC2_CLALP